MSKRTKVTIIAVIVSAILAVAAFASVRNMYPVGKAMGGEGFLLLLPVITYFACKNITISIDTFSEPIIEKLDIEHCEEQIITLPKKVGETTPNLVLIVDNTKVSFAEDQTT